MRPRKQLKLPSKSEKRYRVEFTAYGAVFQVVYFDTAEAAKAHADSFTAIEPKIEDQELGAPPKGKAGIIKDEP